MHAYIYTRFVVMWPSRWYHLCLLLPVVVRTTVGLLLSRFDKFWLLFLCCRLFCLPSACRAEWNHVRWPCTCSVQRCVKTTLTDIDLPTSAEAAVARPPCLPVSAGCLSLLHSTRFFFLSLTTFATPSKWIEQINIAYFIFTEIHHRKSANYFGSCWEHKISQRSI